MLDPAVVFFPVGGRETLSRAKGRRDSLTAGQKSPPVPCQGRAPRLGLAGGCGASCCNRRGFPWHPNSSRCPSLWDTGERGPLFI